MARYLRILFFGLIFCSLTSPLSAQDMPFNTALEGKYWTIGVGIPITTVRDKAHSPFAYRGMHFNVYAMWENIQSKQIFRTKVNFNVGSLKPYVKPQRTKGTSADLTELRVTTAYYRNVNTSDDGLSDQFIGGGLSFRLNTREYSLPSNNVNGFVMDASLQINAMDRRRAFDKTDWSATTTLAMPVVSRVFRPTYIGLPNIINEQKPGFKTVMRAMEWATVNRYFYLDAAVEFNHILKPWRSEQLGYSWSLLHTSMPAYKPLTSVTGGISYGFRYLQ